MSKDMSVYRYLSVNELKNIQLNNTSDIGSVYNDDDYKRVNTHRYKYGVKYLHFFKNKKDVKKMKTMNYLPYGDYYICEFDIPIFLLLSGFGYGYYGLKGEVKLTEFKMPSCYMKSRYLKSYTYDNSYKSEIGQLNAMLFSM